MLVGVWRELWLGVAPMRRVVKVAVGVLFVLLVSGLVVVSVRRVRDAAKIVQCENNLRTTGLALQNYRDVHHCFPTGTLPNANLPPEKRFSWAAQLCPAYMVGGVQSLFDTTKAWDAEGNCPPRERHRTEKGYAERLVGDVAIFLCPVNPARSGPNLPCPMHYLGIAGVGDNAAELPLTDPRAGFVGYDRKVTPRDLKDGEATTMVVAEAIDGGPWTAGGRATLRGLSPTGPSYLGEGGQFSSFHRRAGGLFPVTQPVVVNVLFADGSVHRLSASVSPQVFEALATIAGNEAVDPFDGEEQ
jgi:prepilin-type processing-associated H-X9-DG protein